MGNQIINWLPRPSTFLMMMALHGNDEQIQTMTCNMLATWFGCTSAQFVL